LHELLLSLLFAYNWISLLDWRLGELTWS